MGVTPKTTVTSNADAPFPEVEPYPQPVDPSALLDEVASTLRRFVVVDQEQADAAALWIAFTWLIDSVQVAPLAIVTAPEKACGKSQMLDLLGRLSMKPLPVANTSTASLFRVIEKLAPTLLIDEADTFIRDNGEIKGLINAGHTRSNAFVLRVVGDNYEPKRFSVWGAKALAGISLERHLPDSTMSRAIVFNLRRKRPEESVSRLRHAEPGTFETLIAKLARFANDHADRIAQARPTLPDALSDRAQDNWEPLLAIADCAGPSWVGRATAAALQLSASSPSTESIGNELLADIQQIFAEQPSKKISTVNLITALTENAERPWLGYDRGKEITPRQLARLLATYGIKSKTVRMGNHDTPKGYELSQFEDAFSRYLQKPADTPQQRNEGREVSTSKDLYVADDPLHPVGVANIDAASFENGF